MEKAPIAEECVDDLTMPNVNIAPPPRSQVIPSLVS